MSLHRFVKQKASVATIALLVLSVVFVFLLYGEKSNHNQTATLFDGPQCSNACLFGFEPTVAKRIDVERWLTATQIAHSIGTFGIPNNTIIIDAAESMRLTGNLTDNAISMEFNSNDVLWRISVKEPQLCLDSIIGMYGTPDMVDVGDQPHKFRLGYTHEGLLFGLDLEEESIVEGVFMMSSEWVDHFASLGQRISWDEAQTMIGERVCWDILDAF